MSNKILLTFATRYGSTQEVAGTIAATLRERGLEIDIRPMKDVKTLDNYSAVVMGAPLSIGKWHEDAHHFLAQHQEVLIHRPTAVFALGPISTEKKEMQGCRQQLDKELAKYAWLKPLAVELFVGKYGCYPLREAAEALRYLGEGHARGKVIITVEHNKA